MGVFEQKFEIGASAKGPFVTQKALVDTGSSYSWVPGSILRGLGLKPLEKAELETADGRLITRDLTIAYIRINGRVIPGPVVYGDEDDSPLLGAVTLEIFRLEVDPLKKRLVPVRAMAKGFRLK